MTPTILQQYKVMEWITQIQVKSAQELSLSITTAYSTKPNEPVTVTNNMGPINYPFPFEIRFVQRNTETHYLMAYCRILCNRRKKRCPQAIYLRVTMLS